MTTVLAILAFALFSLWLGHLIGCALAKASREMFDDRRPL